MCRESKFEQSCKSSRAVFYCREEPKHIFKYKTDDRSNGNLGDVGYELTRIHSENVIHFSTVTFLLSINVILLVDPHTFYILII